MLLKHLKNERGISLIMVIIMLVLVGGLTAALLTAGLFNIGFGADEIDRAQAFYAADAGVEYTKNAIRNILYDTSKDTSANEIKEYFDNNYGENNITENISFKIESNDDDNSLISFISTGTVNKNNNEISQRIEFGFNLISGFEYSVLINLLEETNNIEDYLDRNVWLRGSEDEFSMDRIMATDMGSFWEFIDDENDDGYVDVSHADGEGGTPKVTDYKDFDDINDLKEIEDEDEDVTFDNARLFFTPNAGTVVIGDETNIDELDDNKEKLFKEGNVVEYEENTYIALMDNVISGEVPVNPENSDYWEKIEDNGSENFVEWEEGKEYNQYDQVKYNDKNYEAKQNISIKPDISKFWDYIDFEQDEEYKVNSTTFNDSIIIVDGSLETRGDVNFNDSLVIVKNLADIGGSTNLNRSLILAFAHDYSADDFSSKQENIFQTAGTPSVDLELFETPLSEERQKKWPGIQKLFDQLEDEHGTLIAGFRPEFWRQTK